MTTAMMMINKQQTPPPIAAMIATGGPPLSLSGASPNSCSLSVAGAQLGLSLSYMQEKRTSRQSATLRTDPLRAVGDSPAFQWVFHLGHLGGISAVRHRVLERVVGRHGCA